MVGLSFVKLHQSELQSLGCVAAELHIAEMVLKVLSSDSNGWFCKAVKPVIWSAISLPAKKLMQVESSQVSLRMLELQVLDQFIFARVAVIADHALELTFVFRRHERVV